MRNRSISGIAIKAITAALPTTTLDTDFFSSLYGEKEVARIVRGTGIRSIRVAQQISTSQLIVAAVNHLAHNTQLDLGQVDGLIVVTQTPDDWSPGVAYAVHEALDLAKDAFVCDINAGCAGYVCGLIQAASLIASGACDKVLLCTGDRNTRLTANEDYQVRMLFGDAASATLICKGEDKLDFVTGADGTGRKLLGVDLSYDKTSASAATVACLKMDGAAVMGFVMSRVPDALMCLLNSLHLKASDIDLFAMHQPNEFVLNYLRRNIGVDASAMPIDVDGVGNTNSTSIPLVLCRTETGTGLGKANTILCGFGVGLAWNALHLDLSKTRFIQPIDVEDKTF
ncbi:hypothetical protein MUU53_04425 [Rhizobium lemnae]|uniref:3-oxoacyl-ACP synthase III family protein n=1 Tax=Rhizobium lemnae TaxID=1214924 RepID=A0ABV8ECI7_9HYPH|nr:3-oxoacyl-[acyl-carrier-protein] synthase III C-terminal domain-containing protein [Rhizobium lemnae]MCJ8507153.1 hypothetical protein [Rhizobium lemnae]